MADMWPGGEMADATGPNPVVLFGRVGSNPSLAIGLYNL